MTDALGTLTPTSTIVVATRILISLFLNAVNVASASDLFVFPVTIPIFTSVFLKKSHKSAYASFTDTTVFFQILLHIYKLHRPVCRFLFHCK